MITPPVFAIEDVSSDVIDDLRDASATYCGYSYTCAFDNLIVLPDRARVIQGFLNGAVEPSHLADCLREWLLKPWSSVRSLGAGKMQAIADALGRIRAEIGSFPAELPLDNAERKTVARMVAIFQHLDDCAGVGPTIASKLLAPLRPALFPMWDNPIAESYGFALNAAGYHQYLIVTQSIARRALAYWGSGEPLEAHLKPPNRKWAAPLAKVLDEWNWIRITKKHRYSPA